MQPHPCPSGDDADPSGLRSHHTAEDRPEGGDPGRGRAAPDLQGERDEADQRVDGDGEVVAAHRCTRNHPATSQTNIAMVRPGWCARIGSIVTLMVGWAYESVVSDGWSNNWVSSQMASERNTLDHARTPSGSRGSGSINGRSGPRQARATATAPVITT